MAAVSMTWRDLLFAHWRLSPETVRQRLPRGLDVHQREGRAWVGIVAHRMVDVRPRLSPIARTFVEVNLRTYVRRGDRTGVFFFSLDAGDPLAVAVARGLWGLSYFRAATRMRSLGDRVAVDSYRTHPGAPDARFVARYGPDGKFAVPDSGSLPAFLTDRYRLYTPSRVGLLTASLDRRPLAVAPASADLEVETVFEAAGFDRPEGEPHLLYAAPEGIDVAAGWPERVG